MTYVCGIVEIRDMDASSIHVVKVPEARKYRQHFTWLATHNIIRRLNRLDLRIQRCLVGLGVSRSRHHAGGAHTQGSGRR